MRLSEDVLCFQKRGNVIINGDFNAKTSNEDDFITPDKHDAQYRNRLQRNTTQKKLPRQGSLMREENIYSICAKDLS